MTNANIAEHDRSPRIANVERDPNSSNFRITLAGGPPGLFDRRDSSATVNEGAMKLIPVAKDLAQGDAKKAAFMLLTAAICLAPDRHKLLKAVNVMLDQTEQVPDEESVGRQCR